MRTTSSLSSLFAAVVLCLAGCEEPDETPMGGQPGMTTMQNPSQSGLDATPGADAGTVSADASGNDASTGTGSNDAGASGNPFEASIPGAAPGDASATADGSAPEAGAAGYSPCPTDGVCKILPLGDSITYGIGYSGGYRVELFRKAQAAQQRITFVGSLQSGPSTGGFPRSNEGHSGWTIDQIAGLVPSPALQSMPDIVLLMAGTNDVNLSSDLPNAPKRLGALIDKIIAADAHTLVVVAQLTPLTASFFNANAGADVQTLNRAIPEVVAARAGAGKHVVLVDMHSGFPEMGLGDGVHPNRQGYEWMAGVWYQAIGPLLH
jgi:lysophospholipase L1-like esterase